MSESLLISQTRPADGPLPACLGRAAVGNRGRVTALAAGDGDLERQLLEIGFVEGARVEVLHAGPFGGDPIAVQVDDTRVALRRREAGAVLVDIEAREHA